jgi:Tol biopolymer transport system component
VNRTNGQVELFWLDGGGRRNSYGTLAAGDERDQHTYAGHVWEVVDSEGNLIAAFEAEESNMRAVISGRNRFNRRSMERGRDRFRQSRRISDESPDGKWMAFVKDDNVYIRSKDDNTEIQLSRDGSPANSYRMPQWAPDAKTLVVFHVEPGDNKEVYLIESSPPGGGRALLHSRPYDLPGDKFDAYELNIFNIAEHKQIKPELERTDLGSPRPRWNKDGYHFTYEKIDRGHQRFRVIEVNTHDGSSRSIIDEKSGTFIWTAHTENLDLMRVNYLDETDEIIYVSEMDGWRHLYLIDAKEGRIKNQITSGQWVVRGIDLIDEDARQIWFHASGMNSDQDPYFIHYYRVNFDGSELVALTEGNGNHTVQFSPDRKYLIDTYSRVDEVLSIR